MEFKTCVNCFKFLPKTTEYFYRKSGTKNGFKSKCKTCWKRQNNRYYRFNQEAHKLRVYNYKKKCKNNRGQTI